MVAQVIPHEGAMRGARESANSRGVSTRDLDWVSALTWRANDDDRCRGAHPVTQMTKRRG